MDYFIGIDIGTTSTKAVAFDAAGTVLSQQAFYYPITHPQEDRSEQSPEEIYSAVLKGLEFISKALPQHNPVLVSFSAAMHSLLLIDEQHTPITNCIIWADNRAAALAGDLKNTTTGKSFYHQTGVPIHAMSPLCKICWIKDNEPILFKKAVKFIGIKEFVFYKLFKKYTIDTGIASATGLLNSKTLEWQETILAYAGINKLQLSTVVSTKSISYLAQDNLMIGPANFTQYKKTAFVIGSSDGALANLGSGAVFKGSMAITIGTSGAVRLVTDQPDTDEKMRSFCYHLSENQYIVGGASNNGAIVIQWLKENILKDESRYTDFMLQAESISAGCDDLLFLPYILGERAPIWNSAARGVYFGLSGKHNSAHMIRAAMEAVVFNMFAIGKILIEKNNISIIYANGGFTDNLFWVQLLSDMFALPVFIPAIEESSALGAVLIGMEALQLPIEFKKTSGNKLEPSFKNNLILLQQFNKFQRLYDLVKEAF